MALESAEEFACRLVCSVWADMSRDASPGDQYDAAKSLIEADRASIAAAAKLEVLEELKREAMVCEDNCAFGRPSRAESYCAAYSVLSNRYSTKSKEPT